ncbi:hypothetical protein VOLCADRAFT_89436 [Volvox carteri f. nagariensis]|uniref:Peptidase S8/S53 domain-containing protein n=1 Tax=Volvox carteri f. nagariensis TaxID=3068 RepID=D8TRP3_VOLCA|nr:uncharacterized protein VOLCADRAFT_89436 [Volvox carteri f. nagariensis]EFJ49932.1 hypothetical protein VOLCADRAFT_89436 [Volvox carteri f. nagariensis]|eukprot:XP_002948997.1 hypothetical protein VOLCADRAFT_89436 [Volvox carteri f. nagariensis]
MCTCALKWSAEEVAFLHSKRNLSNPSSPGSFTAAAARMMSESAGETSLLHVFQLASTTASLDRRQDLHAGLVGKGAFVMPHLYGDGALMAYLDPASALEVAEAHETLFAPLEPDLKISPELAHLLSLCVIAGGGVHKAQRETNSRAPPPESMRNSRHHPDDGDYLPEEQLPDEACLPRNLRKWDPVIMSGLRHVDEIVGMRDQGASLQMQNPAAVGQPGQAVGKNNGSISPGMKGPALYGFTVHIVPGRSAEELQDMGGNLARRLAAALDRSDTDPCRPRSLADAIYSTHSPRLDVFLCFQDVFLGVKLLSQRSNVLWLTPSMQKVALNALETWGIQTGKISEKEQDPVKLRSKPFWEAGITGKDVTVGVTDTGLDVDSCYFTDLFSKRDDIFSGFDFVDVPNSKGTLKWLKWQDLYLPRKVVQYIIYSGATTLQTHSHVWEDRGGQSDHLPGAIATEVDT